MLTIYSRIVVPYDHSELSKKALQSAMTLAKQDNKIELYVLMVIQPEITIAYQQTNTRENQCEAFGEVRNIIETELSVLPNRTRTFVLEGNPPSLIVDFVKEHDGDLIVMGSRGLSGLKELFLGSVSHYVVQKATCPVLVVK
jgi:nucleotide-binding universal stress UspA family protein